MKLQTKAIYNLLRLNAQEPSSANVEPWALENLREVPLDELFAKLSRLGPALDRHSFSSFASECDTPEELTDLLLEDEVEPKRHDEAYLLIFEIWRKLLPEKQSLSLFCDELDHRIFLYDQEALESDEPIQDALANLQEILDENHDEGEDPERIFRAISEYCAHDLEGFLYDYISELIDNGDDSYASELLDGFSPFVPKSVWFDFLGARLIACSDPAKANAEMAKILTRHPQESTSFLLEMLQFLSVSGEHPLFIAVIQKILAQLQTEDEFEDLMEIAADYYRRLDQDDTEAAIERLMKKRSAKASAFNPRDPDILAFAASLK